MIRPPFRRKPPKRIRWMGNALPTFCGLVLPSPPLLLFGALFFLSNAYIDNSERRADNSSFVRFSSSFSALMAFDKVSLRSSSSRRNASLAS